MYHYITTFATLFLFVNIAISESQKLSCLSSRCSTNEKSIFRLGHTYVYNYSINIETRRFELKNHRTFDTIVEIHVDESCNLILQLYNSTYTSFDKNNNHTQLVEALTKKQLVFEYVDGKITKICSSESEPAWVTNIKLGILSALQYTSRNSTDTYNETLLNINGYCDTNYTISEVDGRKVIRRYTDLNKCEQRTTFEKKKMNLFEGHDMINTFSKSIQTCRHVLGMSGEPILITCRENHAFKLFEYLKKDIKTDSISIKQQLDLDRVVVKNDPLNDDNFTSNEYQYDFTLGENDVFTNKLEDIMEFIASSTNDYQNEYKYQDEQIMFTDSLKSLSNDELKGILNACKPGEKRFLLESLVKDLNMKFFKLISDLYLSGDISDDTISSYFQYLPSIEEPSVEIFDMIEKIRNKMQSFQTTDLSVSTLIKYFCKSNPNCSEITQIQNFIKKLESSLNTPVNSENSNEILLALSSLGNIGYSHQTDLITSIFLDEMSPKLLRIAAIKSLKKMSCEIIPKDELIDFFTDQNNYNILRIEAFLAIAKCLSRNDSLVQILDAAAGQNSELVKMYILKTLKLNGLFDIETDTNSTEKNDIPNSSYDAINKHMNNTTNNATSLFTVTRDMNMIRAFGSSRLDLSEKKFNIIQIDVFYEKSTEKKLINKCYALKSPNLDENEISGVESSDNNVYIFTSFLDSDVYFLNISYSQVNEYFKKSAVQMNQSIEAFDVSYIFSTMTGLPLSFSTRGNLGVNLNKKEKVADHICEFNPYETIDINTWIDIDYSISLQLFKEKIKINHGQYINIPYYKNENF